LIASVALASATAGLALAAPVRASERLADVNVKAVSLKVNERGEALVAYRRENGKVRRVLAWGAVDARHPSREVRQARFRFDYAGGWGKYRREVWKGFRNVCRPYDGPELVYLVAACKAADGSYWALQIWQRIQPLRGFPAFRPNHMDYELHLSHWREPQAVLEVSPNWTYDGRFQGLFGRLLYRGVPVHGYATPSNRRRDDHARFFYIDTYNSVYGPGWKRDAAVVTHVGNGAFCFSFVPQKPPPGYPNDRTRPPGDGERHRVTVMGPGVTPVIQWEGRALGRYDPVRDREYNELFDRIIGSDRVCTRER
jgi:hypothetical protein